jgi:hypothetical protein
MVVAEVSRELTAATAAGVGVAPSRRGDSDDAR